MLHELRQASQALQQQLDVLWDGVLRPVGSDQLIAKEKGKLQNTSTALPASCCTECNTMFYKAIRWQWMPRTPLLDSSQNKPNSKVKTFMKQSKNVGVTPFLTPLITQTSKKYIHSSLTFTRQMPSVSQWQCFFRNSLQRSRVSTPRRRLAHHNKICTKKWHITTKYVPKNAKFHPAVALNNTTTVTSKVLRAAEAYCTYNHCTYCQLYPYEHQPPTILYLHAKFELQTCLYLLKYHVSNKSVAKL